MDRRWQRVWSSAASTLSMGLMLSEELAAHEEYASGSMMPEQTMDQGCKGVRWAMKVSADAWMKDIGILTMAACNLVEGEGSGKSEALGESAVAGDEEMSLSLRVVNEITR